MNSDTMVPQTTRRTEEPRTLVACVRLHGIGPVHNLLMLAGPALRKEGLATVVTAFYFLFGSGNAVLFVREDVILVIELVDKSLLANTTHE